MAAESPKPLSASPPAIDPKDVTSDPKLTPAVAKAILVSVDFYNAKNYPAARSAAEDVKRIPNRSAYEDFDIADLEMMIASAARDLKSGAAAAEAMAISPALADKDRKAVFDNALMFSAGQKAYWRAIQYGELLKRERRLDGAAAFVLPFAYFQAGAYADAEQSAQYVLANFTFPADEKDKLTKLVGLSQIRQGKVAPMPSSFGEALMQSFGSALAQSVSGQPVNNDPQAQMQQAQDESAKAMQQAWKRAAGEVLAADPATEQAVYDDLVHRPALGAAANDQAQGIFGKAFAAYQNKDYVSAQKIFEQGLAIDPTNSAANYYYADCIASQGINSLSIIDYLTRSIVLGESTDETKSAREALQQYASAQ